MFCAKIRQQRKRKTTSRKRKTQIGGFLGRYDFTYGGRDTVNQVAKVAPSIIKNATNKINNIKKDRIDQIISQGGKEIERIFAEVFRGPIEDVYKTPFRMLENFGRHQWNKVIKKILK